MEKTKVIGIEVESGTIAEKCLHKMAFEMQKLGSMDEDKMAFDGSRLIGYVECCEDSGYIEHETAKELIDGIWKILLGVSKVVAVQPTIRK